MHILPAIDLCEGCAVRLLQGDFAKRTVYSDDPAHFAAQFEKDGASWLHVVDLDGAKRGTDVNYRTAADIVAASSMQVELGGGIRSMEKIKDYLALGVKRIILGTAAATNERFLRNALESFGEAIAVGVDAQNGMVAIKGWTQQSGETLEDFCGRLEKLGVKTVICTDISKDGMLGGANIGLYKRLSQSYAMNFIASGGVSSAEDIKALRAMGLYGAIVGKALYTGALSLKDALKAGEGEEA